MKRIMTTNQAYEKLGLCYEDRLHDMLGCMVELDRLCEENGYVVADGILWEQPEKPLDCTEFYEYY